MKRVFSSLPTHNYARIDLTYYLIDDWASSDVFKLTVDATTVYSYNGFTTTSTATGGGSCFWFSASGNICGLSCYSDTTGAVNNNTFSHSASSLTFIATATNSNTSGAYFGIRDFSLNLCHPTCQNCNGATANNCTDCYGSLYLQSDNNSCVTACNSNQFSNTTNGVPTCYGNILNLLLISSPAFS